MDDEERLGVLRLMVRMTCAGVDRGRLAEVLAEELREACGGDVSRAVGVVLSVDRASASRPSVEA